MLSSVRLELLPKAAIDIYITIIENDGIEGCIAAGAIAASTALADAGIEMVGLVVSCSAVGDAHAQTRQYAYECFQCIIGKEIWLDPSEDEADAASATFIYAGMPALGTITSLWQNGSMSSQQSIEVRHSHRRQVSITSQLFLL